MIYNNKFVQWDGNNINELKEFFGGWAILDNNKLYLSGYFVPLGTYLSVDRIEENIVSFLTEAEFYSKIIKNSK